jgi:ABC-type antimicrobial peptide transport system permease subunit
VEGDESLENAVYQAAAKVAGSKAAYAVRSLIPTGWRIRESTLAQQDYQEELRSRARLEDYEVLLSFHGEGRTMTLDSRRVFLDPPIAAAALAAEANAQSVLTYLANLIADGTNATPYSMVTAAGAPWTPAGLRDDEIVINQWLADDLQAKPGDGLLLVYYDPESGARLTERTNTFRVHSIVPMAMPWADRTLMPQFPGIEKAETTAEWDTAFPLVHKIRPQDDEYWTDYRGTPKAFITLAAGQKMWANRFGNLTAVRFPVPTNQVGDEVASLHSDTAQSEPPHVISYKEALEKKILATLQPGELGLRFEPVREQALKAAEQSQHFGGLFIGFSLFVIVAALLLMALLFQFGLEQRAGEIGALLALGLTPNQVQRLFLREGVVLAFIGGALGAVAGIGYAKVMLLGLVTVWRDAVGMSALKFFATPQTLFIGLFTSALVAAFTLWLALRKQVKRPARELMAGGLEGSKLGAKQGMRNRGMVMAISAGTAALGLVAWTLAKGDTANPGAFFGAGALVLICGLGFMSARLVQRSQRFSILRPLSAHTLALRSLSRRRSRSVATASMLASGTFLIVSLGVFRLDANRDATLRSSGTGGFALIGESTMPVVADLNTKAGRESFALNESDFEHVVVVHFRVREGDEASCLNLDRAQKPRLLGVNPNQLEGRFTMAKGEGWAALSSALRAPHSALEVPAIGDANSIQWAMGKKVGDTIDYVDERGRPFKVRIVGAVANSILQGQLIIDEAEFVKRFPGESGYQYFLVDAPINRVANLSAKLSRALQDVGLEVTPAPVRLAQFNAVQNTYLGTFQVLGGLGLLLGSAGLGIVVLRNVLERRGELAVLIAVGWQPAGVRKLVLIEHAALLGLGLMVGLVAAAVAVLPSALSAGGQLPVSSLTVTLLLVLANGLVFTWLATRFALRGELLNALRNE